MSRRRSRLIHLLFILSGAAGLVYQVVWTRQLVLVFGATVQSASVVLAGFMAGFGLGGLWGGKLSLARGRYLRTYAGLEAAVAVLAAAFPWTLKAAAPLFSAAAASLPDAPGRLLALKVVVVCLLLLPSTCAMGATFPVLLSGLGGEASDRTVASLFAANTWGACLGVLASGFLLIGAFGLSATTYIAIAANLAAAGGAYWLSRRDPHSASEPAASGSGARGPGSAGAPPSPHPAPRLPVVCYFASGLCGMASEVIWYRVLAPSFNNSVYGFSTVLAVYLAGLSLGSLATTRLDLPKARLPEGLGAVLLSAGALSLAALYLFEVTQLLQIRFADLYAFGVKPLLAWPLAEASAVLLPVATLQGMVLPLVVRLLGPKPGQAGRLVGRLYAANTAGAILGTLCAGFWWIPTLSVQRSLVVVVCVYAALGLLVLARAAQGRRRAFVAALAVAGVLVAARAWSGTQVPLRVLNDWMTSMGNPDAGVLHYIEDTEASVAVVRRGSQPYLLINGVGVTGYTNVTKTLAHLPLMMHKDPRHMLVICFGMGTTFRAALSHPGLEIDVVDLVPSVPKVFRYFYKDAAEVLADPRARVIIGDGRGWLALRPERYEVIAVDPSPPLYSAGTVNLYNRDFFELAGSRLTPDGILAVWLPMYPEGEFEMVLKSFLEAFPHAQVWKGGVDTGGLVLLGSLTPFRLDREKMLARFRDPGVRRDWLERDREFDKPEGLWKLYLGPKERFAAHLRTVPVLTDDQPWIEYPYFRSKSRTYLKAPEVLSWSPAPVPFSAGASGTGWKAAAR